MFSTSPQQSKLLVVDDSAVNLDLLVSSLGKNYDLRTAISGDIALNLIAEDFLPDLILLDIMMPGMDGYKVCQRLKSNKATQHIPVIFLTSLGSEKDEAKGLGLGAVDYITKPFNPAIVRLRIQTQLELKQHRDHLDKLVAKKIDELKVVQQEEQKKAAFLKSILMSVPVSVCFIIDRKIVWSNQRTAEISGYPCEELEGQQTRMLFPSDELYQQVAEVYSELQKAGTSSFETVWRTKSGTDIDIHVNAAALDKTDLAAGVIFATLDVTQRKQAEEALQFNENRLNQAQQVAQIGSWEYNLKDNTLHWSDEIYRIFAVDAKQFEATYDNFLLCIHPDDRDLVSNAYLDSIKNKTPYDVVHRLLLDDGTIKYVQEKCDTEFDAAGLPIVSFGTVQDITKLKQAEESMRLSEDKYSRFFKLSPDAITLSRLSDGSFLEVNQVFSKLSGWTAQEAIGRSSLDLNLWCSDKDRERMVSALCEYGKIIDLDVSLRHKDGHTTRCLISARQLKVGDEDCLLSITRDITEKKQLEEEASQANRLASLGELAAGVAHEINNPNALILYNSDILDAVIKDLLHFLAENPPADSRQLFGGLPYQEIAQEIPVLLPTIHDSAQRIKRIVNDLRDFARQDSSDIDAAVDVNQVVRAAVRLVNSAIKMATDHFTLNLAETLPAVTGVTGRLDQVVINLLLNACQALENRSKAISISTAYDVETDQLQVKVADEGVGMTAAVMEHILEPFVTSKREQGGTGLGLSVSARIVKEHHGTLRFKSAPGKGTTATISLPVRKEDNYVS